MRISKSYGYDLFHFQPVNSNQVASVLGKVKTSMGFGTDCIANRFLMIGLPVIYDSLCDIFTPFVTYLINRLRQEFFQILGKLRELPLFSKVDKLMIGLTTGLYLFFLYFREFSKN